MFNASEFKVSDSSRNQINFMKQHPMIKSSDDLNKPIKSYNYVYAGNKVLKMFPRYHLMTPVNEQDMKNNQVIENLLN